MCERAAGQAIQRHAGRELLDDALVTAANPDRPPGQPLRTAAISGLAFTVLYVVHRLLQGTGPDSSTAAAVATYNLAHRGALVASEVAVGLGLLAFIPFLAGLVPVIWRAGNSWPWSSPSAVGCLWPWALCPTPPKPR